MAVGGRRCFPEDAMTELTRRRIVAAISTAAAGALAPFAPPAQAAAPLARRQAPSFYRCKVGEFEVTVVNDGARAIPLPAQFVRNVGNEEVLAAATESVWDGSSQTLWIRHSFALHSITSSARAEVQFLPSRCLHFCKANGC